MTMKCSVCLIPTVDLVQTWETDANNVKWSCKLSSCVPEIEWNEEHLICLLCIKQLEVACAFRNLCLRSTVVRKKKWGKCLSEEEAKGNREGYEIKENESQDSDNENISQLIHQCKHCSEKLADRKLLALHNKEIHVVDCPYDCMYCDRSFTTSSNLMQHEKIHENELDYECSLCNTLFNSPLILKKHMIVKHTPYNKWKYACAHCNTKYPLKPHYDMHILRHHTNESGEYICFHCNKKYNSKILLMSHIKTHSCKKFSKQCHTCQNYYANQSILENHMQKEHGIGTAKVLTRRIKQYQCDKCLKLYTTEKVMINHHAHCDSIKRHNAKRDDKEKNDNEIDVKFELLNVDSVKSANGDVLEQRTDYEQENTNPIDIEDSAPIIPTLVTKRGRKKLDQTSNTCQICGMAFNTRYLAKRHVRNVHATEKNYECDVCQQKFASPVYLNAHKRYHSRERPHICSFCGKGFITGSDLYHHEKIHANKRAYKCDKCPKAFNTSSDLHKHKLCVHQDRNEWKYVCTFCERRFPLKTNLDAHTKTHTGERNFACHLCERRCVNRSVLMRHIKSHSNVRLFKCSLCNMEYKYQKSLDIHMTKTHGIGDAKIPERIKKYFCHICPKSYFANNKLQKHIRTHTGERPFSCQMCEKRFIDKSYVKQHLKTAHNVIFNETDIA